MQPNTIKMHKKIACFFFFLTLFLLFPCVAISGQDLGSPATHSSSILLADELAGWPYQFSQDQISRLRAAGCQFNDEDLTIAKRMTYRRFSAEDFVVAYEQASKMGLHGDDLEKIATFQFLLLPMGEYGTMKSKEMNVTNYYNSRIGGKGTKNTGLVLSGVGLISLISGFILISSGSCGDRGDYNAYPCTDDYHVAGGIFSFLGGLSFLTGFPLVIVGSAKTARWAKDLDNTPKDEIEKYRLSPKSDEDTIKRQINNDPEYTKLIFGLSPLIAGGSNNPNSVAFTVMF